ncbi:MAG: sugar phosphorylase [bacterium]|nr:sugar phosphorylase [bacterium]
MNASTWQTVLAELYGEETANAVQDDVATQIERTRGELTGQALPLSEKDIWLISYADQFQRDGRKPLSVLREFLDQHTLPWITGVHVLPFYPWSSDDGFSVTDYLAVDPAYGDWDDVAALADNRRLMADAVINHMSAQSQWFQRFLIGEDEYAGFFRTADPEADLTSTVRPRTLPLLTRFESVEGPRWVWTTFSADQVDLDYRNPRVLLKVLDVLLEYVRRGATAIRLDAICFLWKVEGTTSIHLAQTHAVVHFLRLCLEAAAPGTVLITETNVPHAENISYLGTKDRQEAQLVYQFSLAPLILDALARGDASTLSEWAASLDLTVPGTSFLNFLASHDGVGVRPAEGLIPQARIQALARLSQRSGGGVGERALSDGTDVPYELNSTWFDLMAVDHSEDEAIARHLVAHAVMFALAGVPLIYVHSLFGSSNDQEGYQATGRLRSYNRRKFTDLARLEAALADPTCRAGRISAAMKAMASIRACHPAFHPFADQEVLAAPHQVFAIRRSHDLGEAIVAVNLSGTPVDFQLPPGPWQLLAGPRPSGSRLSLSGWDSAWLGTD